MESNNWKKYQFVTEVQTALIADALAIRGCNEDEKAAILSTAKTTLTEMNAVFEAAERIPDEVSAHDAAVEYVSKLMANTIEEEPDFSQLHLTS
jgi:hypothetical protein